MKDKAIPFCIGVVIGFFGTVLLYRYLCGGAPMDKESRELLERMATT